MDCYKCVRRCPVKAIKIEDSSAQIVPICALPAAPATGFVRPSQTAAQRSDPRPSPHRFGQRRLRIAGAVVDYRI